ncbi:TetR/AcrR family transcriptional regulator C-terminal domain-containing protein [Paenibacillus harenae]|uniref:TetR/AcrR family transcriptional regulator C-terminal domain-containing protein n=1 Tax=Paenibacillus harenae TaxID=306543 RepID=UPI002790108E|nr:TetR/AcrR family transcriptional regulator C-terminal domain-containing protein [Paenibacillus harenae]MDQ0062946.1 AcrR family transcriptional regulator [Paenibacillus harenae]
MARKRKYPLHINSAIEEQQTGYIPLDRIRIIEAALQLLNEIGLKELSMRKIADQLHVKTASLYYHVKDKEQLMQLLTDKISGELLWPETSLPWEEQVYQWADQFRKVLLAHKDAVELFNQTIAVGYERLTQIEKLYQLLVSAGFSDPQVPWIASMLKSYVLGFAAEEVRLNAIAGKEHSSYGELEDKYDSFYRKLPEERFPNVVRLASYTTKSSVDNEFKFGLDVLIDGFTAKLAREK